MGIKGPARTFRSRCVEYLAVTLLIASQIACQNKREETHEWITKLEATELITQYTRVLAAGDSASVLPFWSSRSTDKPDFWNLHAYVGGRIRFRNWADFLTDHNPRVEDIRPFENHAVIDLAWVVSDSSQTQTRRDREMRYYVIPENGRWVFINPIDLLTQDWKSYESEHFIYHFPPEIRISEHMHEIRASDQSFESMLHFFGLDLTEKIHFFAPRTAEEAGELILHPPANGYAVLPPESWLKQPLASYKIVSPSFYHPHEVAHCLTALAGIITGNHVVSEGFAVALGGGAASTKDLTLIEAKNALDASTLVPLEDLFTMPADEFFQKNYITYYESGALIRFLRERFGMDKLRLFCAKTQDSRNLSEILEATLEVPVDTLENHFHEYLLTVERARIGFDIPSKAAPVFTMEDPEDDDTGDGDYVYPQHPNYEDGVFDLRQFSVLKDEDNAYFRITMSRLMTPLSYSAGGEAFTPCIVVAIHKGRDEETPQYHDVHGVQLPLDAGYHVKLSIGSAISLSNHLGRVYFTTPDIVYDRLGEEESSVAFSVPIDMIGEPEQDWRYFVGVGLTTNRVMNFIYAGPAPVRQNHPAFISGGNFAQGNPDFIDILLAPDIDQERVLSQYDVPKNIKPIVPMAANPI